MKILKSLKIQQLKKSNIKNVSAIFDENMMVSEKRGRLACELKNKELKVFQSFLKDNPNLYNKNTITIDYVPWEVNGYVDKAIFVNDYDLRVSDETLPKFSLLAKLLKSVKESPEGFPVETKHLESSASFANTFGDLPHRYGEKQKELVKKAHNHSVAQNVSDYIGEKIDRMVTEYFGVDYQEVLKFRKENLK